MSIGKYKRYP